MENEKKLLALALKGYMLKTDNQTASTYWFSHESFEENSINDLTLWYHTGANTITKAIERLEKYLDKQ